MLLHRIFMLVAGAMVARYSLSSDRITPPVGYSRLISWLPRRVRLLPKLARCPRNIVARNHDGLAESIFSPSLSPITRQLATSPMRAFAFRVKFLRACAG